MANTNLTADLVLKEAKRIFKNNCPFITSMQRSYDDSFQAHGAMAGESIRIRKPMKYTTRSGKTMSVQNNTETAATLTKSTWRGVDLKFSQKELSLDLNRFSELYIAPAMAVLASTVEQICMTAAYQQSHQAITLPVTAFDRADIILARTMLNEMSTPQSDRYAIINPDTEGDILNANSGLFNPQQIISRQYTEGEIGKAYGFDFAQTPNVPSLTISADTSGTVNGAGQTGSTLTVTGLTAAFTEGMKFTIGDDVFALNPVTQASTGRLQVFTVGSGATTTSIPITPAITVTGNQKTVSATPDNSDTLNVVGTATVAYPQNLFYNKMAHAFGTADLEMPKGLDFAARNTEDNLSMSIMRDFDIINADTYCRIDILFGFVTVSPEWSVVGYGV